MRLLRLVPVLLVGGAVGCATLGAVLPRDPLQSFKDRLGGGTAQDGTLSTGLVTDTSDIDAEPPGYRVSWIKWDSGFRGSGLQIGDRVVAIDGERVVRPSTLAERQRTFPQAIGQYAENQRWKERGASDGATVTLTVRRRAAGGVGSEEHQVKGVIANERTFTNDRGRNLFGPGGPEEMGSDDFSGAWSSWYESFVRRCQRVLDGGWQSSLDSRSLLGEHLADQARVEHSVQHYAGPFAAALKADFEAVRASLAGRPYPLDEAALAYRQLGEVRAAQIATIGEKARAAFLEQHKAHTISPFPAVDPIRGDRKLVTGKVVVMAGVGNRDWVSEAGHGYIAWSDGHGWYFLDSWSPSAVRMLEAMYRYRKHVSPQIDERFAVIGRIRPEPSMVVVAGRAVTGLTLDVIGASVGDKMFVDVTRGTGVTSPFAGEEALLATPDVKIAKDASPRQVTEAFVAAVKSGDEQTWRSLFATWQAEKWRDDGGVIWYPYYERHLDGEWESSRRLILDRVYDARVVYVGDVTPLLTGKEVVKGPVVDQVTVELDHVGRFDGEYRAFNGVAVHRVWRLQRVDGGPWRIASGQGL